MTLKRNFDFSQTQFSASSHIALRVHKSSHQKVIKYQTFPRIKPFIKYLYEQKTKLEHERKSIKV
jgi:hypothetical protein